MITEGKLYQTINATSFEQKNDLCLCEVVSMYDKRDIDPYCSQSVAIVSMVKAMWMSGPHIGKTFTMTRKTFNQRWRLTNDA